MGVQTVDTTERTADRARAPGGEEIHPGEGLDFERIVFFSDAVFAIAITLLALEIRLPIIAEPAALPAALAGLLPQIFTYVLSFLVVGLFWVGHHRIFRFITGYNYQFVWLNVFFLLGVAFIPVPTQVVGQYGDTPLGTIFYAGCLVVIGLLELLLWCYAAWGHRLVPADASPRLLRFLGLRILVGPVVFALSIPIALFNPYAAQASWALIVLGHAILRRRYPHEHQLRD